MKQFTNQIPKYEQNSTQIILTDKTSSKVTSISFDKNFYRELDQKNFYKKTKFPQNILKKELLIVQQTSKFNQIIANLKKIPSFILGQIIIFTNFLASIPPFSNILEITKFLTRSRDF